MAGYGRVRRRGLSVTVKILGFLGCALYAFSVNAIPMDTSAAALREYYSKYKDSTTLGDDMMANFASQASSEQRYQNADPELFAEVAENARSESELKQIAAHSNKQATSASEFVGDIAGFFSHMFDWGSRNSQESNIGLQHASADSVDVQRQAESALGRASNQNSAAAGEASDGRSHGSMDFAKRAAKAYSMGKLAVEYESNVEDDNGDFGSLFLDGSRRGTRKDVDQLVQEDTSLERELRHAGFELDASTAQRQNAEHPRKRVEEPQAVPLGSTDVSKPWSGALGARTRRNARHLSNEYLINEEHGLRGLDDPTMEALAVQRALLDDYNDGLSKLQQLRNRIHDLNMMHEMMTHSLENMNEIIENMGDRMADTIINQKQICQGAYTYALYPSYVDGKALLRKISMEPFGLTLRRPSFCPSLKMPLIKFELKPNPMHEVHTNDPRPWQFGHGVA
ncbi:hypothetical protein FVE85_0907 [Porphyridium purpureum]|uniref:Uncharacterized protein n=1 Tax=Porphyridium purpureum TaxID=35688 RepID=A0A5J4Z1H0_PORPP|nr:hypothetical protein FVE85_0907 [Porphyridium purpureum]|eukprot:POR1720..scf208_2